MIAACPGSSLGVLIFLPLESSFWTSSSCCCVEAMFCVATEVRSRLLTRASWMGKMAMSFPIADCRLPIADRSLHYSAIGNRKSAILSHHIQHRIHHLIHRRDQSRGALEGSLLANEVHGFFVEAHAAERFALRLQRLQDDVGG